MPVWLFHLANTVVLAVMGTPVLKIAPPVEVVNQPLNVRVLGGVIEIPADDKLAGVGCDGGITKSPCNTGTSIVCDESDEELRRNVTICVMRGSQLAYMSVSVAIGVVGIVNGVVLPAATIQP